MSSIGIVAIGRNEGERLIRCLNSLIAQLPQGTPIVYVDSGSTDGSVAAAEALGVQVEELDLSIPFTMARGRNTGFRYLIEKFPDLDYVQFIDGDCELLEGWIPQAVSFLDSNPQLAIVTGRRLERYPETSIYNLLADLEWNTAIGEATECGGDILTRVKAIREVEGFNESLIAGEEPDMCVRLRQKGWKIWRIDVRMTLHDAAMTKFSQWWKRSVRGGWAAAAGSAMHGQLPEKFRVKEVRSGWLWGVIVPIVAIALAGFTKGLSLLLLLAYPYQMFRIYQYRCDRGDDPAAARIYSFFCVLSKFPQAIGQAKYWLQRWQGKQATLIEYKASSPQVSGGVGSG